MDYVLDSSALIVAWQQWYRIKNFPPFWRGIETLARESRLCVPDAVIEELGREQNDLHDWCIKRRDVLESISEKTIQDGVRRLQERFPLLRTAEASPGKHFADPFVIATAQILGAAVISNEDAEGKHQEYMVNKIPDICRILDVNHYQVHRIVVNEGWILDTSNEDATIP